MGNKRACLSVWSVGWCGRSCRLQAARNEEEELGSPLQREWMEKTAGRKEGRKEEGKRVHVEGSRCL